MPLADIPNELFGGPMLLRVPAASLQDLATYGELMAKLGYPYYAIGTRVAFEPNESYPKFVFTGIRPLTEEEGKAVVALQEDQSIVRILAESSELVPTQAPQAACAQQPVATAGGFGATAPVAQAQPAPQPTPAPQAAKDPPTQPTGNFEIDLDAELEKLLSK